MKNSTKGSTHVYEDGFVCGGGFDDAEGCTFTDVFATREEAIAAGQTDVGWRPYAMGFETARIVNTIETMPNQLDAEHVCDNAENDEWGEALMEQWQDEAMSHEALTDLQARLDKVWEEWTAARDLSVRAYRFEEIEHHEFATTEVA